MIKRVYISHIVALITISSVAQTSLKPGLTFRDCPDCPEMVVIPSGKFTIGSPANEEGRFSVEGPEKNVNIKQFDWCKFDVTR
jgi:formylglycine-generating enzyme required for sulfatase activity